MQRKTMAENTCPTYSLHLSSKSVQFGKLQLEFRYPIPEFQIAPDQMRCKLYNTFYLSMSNK